MSDLAAIVAAHSDAVWRTAFRLLGNEHDARDCLQETFLAALRLAPAGDVRHWRSLLVRIATRRAIDQLRRRYQTAAMLSTLPESAAGPPVADTPAARLEREEFREQVRQALALLPPDQAEAFWLRHLEGLAPLEVARVMAIEPGHARVLVHRAAAGLRRALGPSYGPASLAEESP
jgi:RNA polymerase sigma-70 factor (ECF subfamily)